MFEFSLGFRPAPQPKCCCICHAHSGVLCCAEGQPLKQRAAACCQLCCLVATQGCCLVSFQPLPLAHVTRSVGCGSMLLSVAGHKYITTCSLHHCDMLTTHERPPQPSTAGGEHAVTHASFSCWQVLVCDPDEGKRHAAQSIPVIWPLQGATGQGSQGSAHLHGRLVTVPTTVLEETHQASSICLLQAAVRAVTDASCAFVTLYSKHYWH